MAGDGLSQSEYAALDAIERERDRKAQEIEARRAAQKASGLPVEPSLADLEFEKFRAETAGDFVSAWRFIQRVYRKVVRF